MALKGRAVFLDRDGTLIEDVPYNVDTSLIRFMPGTMESLRLLQDAGFQLIVVTNQSGVALGYYSEEEVNVAKRFLIRELELADVFICGFYYCPHLPKDIAHQHPKGIALQHLKDPRHKGECNCHKPAPGLILQAAQEHSVDLEQSWVIGDILDDIEAGRRAGCRTILIDNGHETEWELSRHRMPHHMVSNIREAVKIVMAMSSPAILGDSRSKDSQSNIHLNTVSESRNGIQDQ